MIGKNNTNVIKYGNIQIENKKIITNEFSKLYVNSVEETINSVKVSPRQLENIKSVTVGKK